ncbi:unnamed protein product [Blepharisma stoltei]|uniref:Uncharacterized protein n=1 Tax=Blepharisma stoltei TaxID=1481888 RepID=A0AAU9J9H0_9CILI|nr:unnamed protein product [Blepharisma stoltei]
MSKARESKVTQDLADESERYMSPTPSRNDEISGWIYSSGARFQLNLKEIAERRHKTPKLINKLNISKNSSTIDFEIQEPASKSDYRIQSAISKLRRKSLCIDQDVDYDKAIDSFTIENRNNIESHPNKTLEMIIKDSFNKSTPFKIEVIKPKPLERYQKVANSYSPFLRQNFYENVLWKSGRNRRNKSMNLNYESINERENFLIKASNLTPQNEKIKQNHDHSFKKPGLRIHTKREKIPYKLGCIVAPLNLF